jgi:phospholipase C
VSFLKAPAYQDGHAGYSAPLDEQAWITRVINFLQRQPDWRDTAVIIAWDDSDGWYDHAFGRTTSPSFDYPADQLNGPGVCGQGTPPVGLAGKPVNGRCGPGTRTPFFVISPWARANYVSHTYISQASITRFIEDNWLHGQRLGGGAFDATTGSIMDMFDFSGRTNNEALFLDEQTGEPAYGRQGQQGQW